MKSIELAVIILIVCVTSFVLGYGCCRSLMKGKVTISDGLVRKSDVTKIIEAYFTARIDLCHTAEEAANETIHGIDLIQLIRDMKEVKDE